MLVRDGIFSEKFRSCTVRATAMRAVEPNGQSFDRRNDAALLQNFFRERAKVHPSAA
jgi:hypothetical protein